MPTLKDMTDEVVVHCNIKSNAELIASILDYDIENKEYLREAKWLECFPAKNAFIETVEDIKYKCSSCRHITCEKTNFCPFCGKRMVKK